MRILLRKFGPTLVSRPAGKEAWLAFQPTLNELKKGEDIEIDFEGAEVLGPSWADEFLTPLIKKYGKRVKMGESDNLSVKATLKVLNIR